MFSNGGAVTWQAERLRTAGLRLDTKPTEGGMPQRQTPDLPRSAGFLSARAHAAASTLRWRADSCDRWRNVVAMQATWSQPVAEVVVVSNDFARRRQRQTASRT